MPFKPNRYATSTLDGAGGSWYRDITQKDDAVCFSR